MGLDLMDPEHLEHEDIAYDEEVASAFDANVKASEEADTFLHAQADQMRRSSSWRTYVMLIAVTINYVMVPGFFASIGWALAVIVLFWGWGHSLITGLMLDKVSEAKPQILSYPDLVFPGDLPSAVLHLVGCNLLRNHRCIVPGAYVS